MGSTSRQGRLNPLGQPLIGFVNETPDGRRVPDGFYAVPVGWQSQASGQGMRDILSRFRGMFAHRNRDWDRHRGRNVEIESAVSEDAPG